MRASPSPGKPGRTELDEENGLTIVRSAPEAALNLNAPSRG